MAWVVNATLSFSKNAQAPNFHRIKSKKKKGGGGINKAFGPAGASLFFMNPVILKAMDMSGFLESHISYTIN